MFDWLAGLLQQRKPLPPVELAQKPLPELKPQWVLSKPRFVTNNLHLVDREKGSDFIVLGSGPSIQRFNRGFREGKRLITLCGAQSSVSGDYYFPDSTSAGWNGLRSYVSSGQTLLMPASLHHPAFVRELDAFTDLDVKWFQSTTAPANDLKWYHRPAPYEHRWWIDNKFIPHNTGAQAAATAVSLAIIMGAKNIYLAGVDGFADLLRKDKPLYIDEFCNAHYQKHLEKTQIHKYEHLKQRELRDAADRFIFGQIRIYCQSIGTGIYVLNEDSHLNGVLSLVQESERI